MHNHDNLIEVDFDPQRMHYLFNLYNIKQDDLLARISQNSAKVLTEYKKSVQNKKITIGLLKKIDKIFGKGLNWYISNRPLDENKSASIFFRKDKFNTDLNFEAKKITQKFEEKKFQVQALCNAIQFDPKRKTRTCTLNDSPKEIANEMQALFNTIQIKLVENKKSKDPITDIQHLKNYINILGELNIFVFEFIEQWKKREKANFNGCFMHPHTIILQRQKYYRREIFTLIHEFAHYLLNTEEIENIPQEGYPLSEQSKIERWCNDFAYYFLIKNYDSAVENAKKATKENEYNKELIDELYSKTTLSRSALYTRFRILNKITQQEYDNQLNKIHDAIFREREEKRNHQREERNYLKQQGIKVRGFPQKPIQSNLYKEIVKINFFEGRIDETRLCDYLQIKPNKINKELY